MGQQREGGRGISHERVGEPRVMDHAGCSRENEVEKNEKEVRRHEEGF